jgi:hypothetical protein
LRRGRYLTMKLPVAGFQLSVAGSRLSVARRHLFVIRGLPLALCPFVIRYSLFIIRHFGPLPFVHAPCLLPHVHVHAPRTRSAGCQLPVPGCRLPGDTYSLFGVCPLPFAPSLFVIRYSLFVISDLCLSYTPLVSCLTSTHTHHVHAHALCFRALRLRLENITCFRGAFFLFGFFALFPFCWVLQAPPNLQLSFEFVSYFDIRYSNLETDQVRRSGCAKGVT